MEDLKNNLKDINIQSPSPWIEDIKLRIRVFKTDWVCTAVNGSTIDKQISQSMKVEEKTKPI